MIPFLSPKRPASVLGLWLDGQRLEGVVVRRINGSLEVRQSFGANLALSPLNGDPELVGREIRNHLDAAGIRERRCAFCLPLNWLLSLQTNLPDLPEAERASFLQLEAERGFHSDDLLIANSIFKTTGGASFATLIGFPRSNAAALEAALAAAKLTPVTFGLGPVAMEPPGREPNIRVFTLFVGANTIALQVTAGGGIVALRSLDGAFETEGAQKRLSSDLIARELRITLGQLPGEPADRPYVLKVYGQTELARNLVSELHSRVAAIGLTLETGKIASDAKFEGPVPPEIAISPALALAANWVRGVKSNPEFLPPKISQWQQFASSRLSPRKLIPVGAALGFAVFCVLVAFGVQQWKIHSLQTQWKRIASQVDEINQAQDQIRKYRPWYDDQFRALQALRKLSQAFPEDGAVNAKTIEIRDLAGVSVSGTARNNQAFLAMHDKLGKIAGISGLHAEVPNAKPPMQFSLNFTLEGAITNGN